ARVITQMGLKEDPSNVLIMQATGVNVSGQIASVIAGGLLLQLIAR
ncbi:MAG: sodium ion-translocating decarboxylase subunit beta, partial [Clostridiales bacterium]|nr:sodium ion-translocating decarboxylase subunit beta [Clostridiales bacterium]